MAALVVAPVAALPCLTDSLTLLSGRWHSLCKLLYLAHLVIIMFPEFGHLLLEGILTDLHLVTFLPDLLNVLFIFLIMKL